MPSDFVTPSLVNTQKSQTCCARSRQPCTSSSRRMWALDPEVRVTAETNRHGPSLRIPGGNGGPHLFLTIRQCPGKQHSAAAGHHVLAPVQFIDRKSVV